MARCTEFELRQRETHRDPAATVRGRTGTDPVGERRERLLRLIELAAR
jgi:hypothetical protein